jgi:membrane-associated PAP2 superfamily phosphatase
MSINRDIVITLSILIIIILIFNLTNFDTIIQNHFFNFKNQEWILDRDKEPYKFIFYDGIKKLLFLIASIFLIIFIFFKDHKSIKRYKKGILIVILSAIFVPIVVGGLKKATNMPCPKNEIEYGGIYPSTKVWESYPKTFKQPSNTMLASRSRFGWICVIESILSL